LIGQGRIAPNVNQRQYQNIRQASEQLTDSASQSFRMLADRTVALQESNLRLTQNFFENWMEQLQNQTQGNRQATQNLQEQGQRQREAFETLSKEAANAYSEFLNSALSFYQEALSRAMQIARGNLQEQEEAAGARILTGTGGGGGGGAPRSPSEAASEGNGASSQSTTGRIEKGELSMADISQFVDKDYEQEEFSELAEAPVDAIQGVSKGDAEKLQQAFNVKTVRDLAENKFVRIAQAIVTLSGSR
jgi:hypothetical protein